MDTVQPEGSAPHTVDAEGDPTEEQPGPPNLQAAAVDTPRSRLAPQHLEYLKERAIDPALAWREGVRSLDEAEVHCAMKNPLVIGGGLAFSYDVRGLPIELHARGYARVYLDDRVNNQAKALIPAGGVYPYIVSSTTTGGEPVYICEAPPKALALASAGYPDVIALGGVDGGFFEKKTGGGSAPVQAALLPFFPRGRTVVLVFDAGRSSNTRVAAAETKIARRLLDMGCAVKLVELPLPVGGGPDGPDDFIAAHGPQAFAELVAKARPADPLEYAKLAALDPAKARAILDDLTFAAAASFVGPAVQKEIAKALSNFHDLDSIKKAWSYHKAQRSAAKQGKTVGTGAKWESGLLRSKDGDVLSCTANVQLILESDPRWTCIAFDLLANDIVFERPPAATEFLLHTAGSKWVDPDDVALSTWLHRTWGIDYPYYSVRAVAALAAHRREFCPVQRRLGSLCWDGTPRADAWLTEYLGVAPSEYSRLVGRLWLVSAVARIFQPGCQVDYVLTLEGEQRTGKSSALRILAMDDAYFTDAIKSVSDIKQVGEQIAGKWVIELAELAAIKRADLEPVKAFITRRDDRYRPSYGRSAMDFPRRCVLAATVNRVGDLGYLRDASGNERWWPVLCGKIDCERLATDREQLWAEAVHLFKSGARWYPDADERERLCVPQQDARREVDAWEQCIRRHLRGVKEWTTTERILTKVVDVPLSQHDQLNVKRVAQILHVLGWESYLQEKRDDKGDPLRPRTRFRAWRRTPKAEPFVENAARQVEPNATEYEAGAIPVFPLKPEDLLQ